MTPQEFITWLKGFAAAANTYNVTPAQWEQVKEQLARVHSDTPTLNYWHSTSTATTLPSEASVNYTTSNKTLLND